MHEISTCRQILRVKPPEVVLCVELNNRFEHVVAKTTKYFPVLRAYLALCRDIMSSLAATFAHCVDLIFKLYLKIDIVCAEH
jgi:hypothetical protein